MAWKIQGKTLYWDGNWHFLPKKGIFSWFCWGYMLTMTSKSLYHSKIVWSYLFETVFRNDFALLKAEIHHFLLSCLMWNTLYISLQSDWILMSVMSHMSACNLTEYRCLSVISLMCVCNFSQTCPPLGLCHLSLRHPMSFAWFSFYNVSCVISVLQYIYKYNVIQRWLNLLSIYT